VKHRFHEFLPGTAPRPVPANWYYNRLHNVYVDYAAERGVPAMLALLAFLLMILHDMRRALRATMRGEERRFLFFGCIAVTMGLMIAGVWEVNLGDSDVLGLFLAVVGCAYAARDFPECDLV
jgi:O-antigen ligase